MFKAFRNRFYALPTPLAGLALGIASLGLGLENALPLHSIGQTFGAFLAVLLLLAIASKFVFHPGLLREELKHPVLGSVMPTFAMALMLVSKSAGTWHAQTGETIWLTAIVLHLALMLSFVYYRIKSFSLEQMVPSWFIPFVGIIVAAVTVPGDRYFPLAYVLLVFGMLNYAVLLPVMTYRLMFSREVADAAKPTIAIMAAPASLSLVGYLNVVQDPSLLLGSLLLGIAVLMTFVIYLAFFKLLRLPFSPAFASYTFPMAVGATAIYKVAEYIEQYPAAAEYARQLCVLGVIEMVIASLIVIYVCLRYMLHYVRSWRVVTHSHKVAGVEQMIRTEPEQAPASEEVILAAPVLAEKLNTAR